jgi:hypothetical protein
MTMPSDLTTIDGQPHPHVSDPYDRPLLENTEFMVEIANCRRHEKHLITGIRAAISAGRRKRAFDLQRRYLQNPAAKKVAVFEAWKNCCRGGRRKYEYRRCTADQLHNYQTNLNVYSSCDEAAYVRPQQKRNGGYRPVCDFGIANRSRQLLTRRALEPFCNPRPEQYLFNGGRDQAVEATASAIRNGAKYAVRADIRNCFGSIDPTDPRFADTIPLTARVKENVLSGLHLNLICGVDLHHPGHACTRDYMGDNERRRGLPQGSNVSSLVAEIVLADMLQAVPEFGSSVVFADDFAILCSERDEAERIVNALRAATLLAPAGPLDFSVIEIRELSSKGIYFLGYWFREDDSEPHITPRGLAGAGNQIAAIRLADELHDFVYCHERFTPAWYEELQQLQRRYLSWCDGYKHWHNAEVFKRNVVHRIGTVASGGMDPGDPEYWDD